MGTRRRRWSLGRLLAPPVGLSLGMGAAVLVGDPGTADQAAASVVKMASQAKARARADGMESPAAAPHGAVKPREPAVESGERPEARSGAGQGEGGTGPGLHRGGKFFGEPDYPRRRALATEPIAHIELGQGGRSVAFKITLEDGTEGYYKPEQSFSAAHWFAEVAAYYLDRELGLGRVPPTVGRRMPWEPLREVAEGHPRLDEVKVQPDGTVRGAFVWWVPEGLDPIEPGAGWEKWVRQNGGLAISPYQAPFRWRRQLRQYRCAQGDEQACRKRAERLGEEEQAWREGEAPESDRPVAAKPDDPRLPASLSDMILFDYLINNVDRWGSRFTNVRTRGEDGPLVFLDQGAGFFWGHRNSLMDTRLRTLQRFRRSTVKAIRELDLESYKQRMSTDPLAPLLDEHRMKGLAIRREHLLQHVEDMVDEYGQEAAFAW